MRIIVFHQMRNMLTKSGCCKQVQFDNGMVVKDKAEILMRNYRANSVKVFNYKGVFVVTFASEALENDPIGLGIQRPIALMKGQYSKRSKEK